MFGGTRNGGTIDRMAELLLQKQLRLIEFVVVGEGMAGRTVGRRSPVSRKLVFSAGTEKVRVVPAGILPRTPLFSVPYPPGT